MKRITRSIILLFSILLFSCSAVWAEEGFYLSANSTSGSVDAGNYEGVDWSITEDYELIIGTEGQTQILENNISRSSALYPWDAYRNKITSISFKGTVKANGSLCGMFADMQYCRSIDLAGLDTKEVTDINEMFRDCRELTKLDLSGFDLRKVTSWGAMLLGVDPDELMTPLNFRHEVELTVPMYDSAGKEFTFLPVSRSNSIVLTRNSGEAVPHNNAGSYIKYSVNTDGTSCTIEGYKLNTWKDPFIPSVIDGYSVTSIQGYAFSGTRLTGTLTISDGIQYIGESAFFASYYDPDDPSVKGLSGDLILPDSVTEIGSAAFCENTFGGRLKLPSSLTKISNTVFSHCSFSEDIVIPDSVVIISDDAFNSGHDGTYLLLNDAKMILNKKLRIIGDRAFYWTGNFGDIEFPQTLVEIGDHAFRGSRFDSVIIPSGVVSVGQSALGAEPPSKDVYVLNDDIELLDMCSLGTPYYTTIHANPGSNAQKYAVQNGYKFTELTTGGSSGGTEPEDPGNNMSGVYEGVDWMITPELELIIGKDGVTQSLGNLEEESRAEADYPWNDYRETIKSVRVAGTVDCYGGLSFMFSDMKSVASFELGGLITSHVTDMHNMFFGCMDTTTVDISGFDTSKVTDMKCMFEGCSSLESIDLTGLNTSSVRNMNRMFRNCTSLKTLDLSGFDMSGVTSADYMLYGVVPSTLETPRNVSISVQLGSEMYEADGSKHSILPQQIQDSITLFCQNPNPDNTGGDDNNDPQKPDDPVIDPPEKAAQSVVTSASAFNKTTNSSNFNIGARAKTSISYKSNNTRVATVDAKGLVRITGPGKALITASAGETTEYKEATAKVTINVTLAAPKLSAKNLKGKKVKLVWSQVKSADGYKIYIKGPSDKKYKLRLTKNAKVKSVTHKGLKKGKKYKYKVVAFKKINGRIVCSAYSQVKTVKIKK
ncbi:MAG: leucine-rich repeat protein [Mogibacterium sp.]|nr:leucine-rich repeat protein [Mogibacterium sp.]